MCLSVHGSHAQIAAVGELDIVDNAAMGPPEGEEKIDYGSPSSLPILKHGDMKIAQSLAIEAYFMSIAPKFAGLTKKELAKDGMMCNIKEDINMPCVKMLFGNETNPEEVKKHLDRWFPVVEHLLREAEPALVARDELADAHVVHLVDNRVNDGGQLGLRRVQAGGSKVLCDQAEN